MFKKVNNSKELAKEKLLTDLYFMIPNGADLKDDLSNLSLNQLMAFYERYLNHHQDIGSDAEADKISVLFNFIIFTITIFMALKLFFFKLILDKVPDNYTAYFYMCVFSVITGVVISWYLKNQMVNEIKDKNDSATFSNINNAIKIYDEVKNIKVFINSMDDIRRLSKLNTLKSSIKKMN
jgi:hypothetical protein